MTLSVLAGGVAYTYEAEIIDGPVRLDAAFDGESPDKADLTLRLDAAGFIGAYSVFALPLAGTATPTPYRARLADDEGNVIINGHITIDDVLHVPDYEIWEVTIVDGAVDRFRALMEASDVISGGSATIQCEIKQQRGTTRAEGLDISQIVVENVFFHDIVKMFEATVAALTPSVALTYKDPARDEVMLDVDYSSGDPSAPTIATASRKVEIGICEPFARDETDGSDRPLWNGWQIWELVRDIAGWNIAVVYDAFPAETMLVQVFPDTFTFAASAVVSLENLNVRHESPAEYGREAADLVDFAVQYKNNVGDIPLLTSESAEVQTYAPEDAAVYGARQRRLDGAGRGTNENRLDLPVFLAHYKDPIVTLASPALAGHPAYSETTSYAVPVIEEKRVWVVEIVASLNGAVAYRTPASPASYELPRHSGAYASNIAKQHGMKQAPKYFFSGTFDVASVAGSIRQLAQEIGDPAAPMLFRGILWTCRSLTLDADLLTADIKGVIFIDVPGEASGTPAVGAPVNFSATLISKTPWLDPGVWRLQIDFAWDEEPLAGYQGQAASYRLERFDDATTSWQFAASISAPTRFYAHLEYIQEGIQAMFRLRSENAFGVSNWVYSEVVNWE